MQKSIYRYDILRRKVCEFQEDFKVSMPGKVAEFLRLIGIASEEQEHMVALTLDAKNRITGYYTVAIGTADSAPVHFRDLFRRAVMLNALSIVMAHNHPSGECGPSADDIGITRRAREIGDMIGIRVLDHVIVGETEYFSFVEKGMI